MSGFDQQDSAPGAAPAIEEAERSVAPWFSVPYPEQLERKQQTLRQVLGRPFDGLIRSLLPSPQIVGHRNKMEFSFGYDPDDKPALGFHQRGKFWRVRDLNRSLLLTDAANRVYAQLKHWALETGLPFYRQIDNRGFFRYLVIREGKRTGEIMVNLVVNPTGFEAEIDRIKSELVTLAERLPAITSLWLTYRRSVGDAALGEASELLAGSPVIHEKLLDLTFRISPASFFQVNTFGAEVLYQALRQLVAQVRQRQTLVDLYCGSGGMALALSRQFERVTGIDSDAESIRLAVENASLNQIDNCAFLCARARQARQLVSPPIDVLVVDPPRAGLAPKTVRSVARLLPQHLIYISCNPRSFRENVRMLKRRFRVGQIIPIDLFPHTPHVELIAALGSVRGAD